jgi:methylmalonyl-CoA/ethylmalonyl-CoA epimerase
MSNTEWRVLFAILYWLLAARPPPALGRLRSKQMIGKLNHVAIVVPDLEKAARTYRETLGARVSAPTDEPDHGVTVVFVELPNTKIELLHPLGENSPVAKFLERNPDGGMHHLCYEVEDIIAARDRLKAEGARVLGDGEPRIGAHGKPVLFLHPKDFVGTLVEIEQV